MSSTGHQSSRALYVPERLAYGGCGNIKFQPFSRFFNVAALRLNLALYGSETPALPVPKQRPCACRATLVRSGTAFKMSITPITNQSLERWERVSSPPEGGRRYLGCISSHENLLTVPCLRNR
jgi:hypothetical protein